MGAQQVPNSVNGSPGQGHVAADRHGQQVGRHSKVVQRQQDVTHRNRRTSICVERLRRDEQDTVRDCLFRTHVNVAPRLQISGRTTAQ